MRIDLYKTEDFETLAEKKLPINQKDSSGKFMSVIKHSCKHNEIYTSKKPMKDAYLDLMRKWDCSACRDK